MKTFPKSLAHSAQWLGQHGQVVVTLSLSILALNIIYWRIVRGYTPPVSYVVWPEPPGWVRTLYALRWGVRAAQVVAGATLLYLEWINQGLSRWLRAVLRQRIGWAVIVGASALLLGSYLLQPGNFGAGDAPVQRSSSGVVWDAIRDGQKFAFWTNYAFLGSPFTQFHNSIYYYLVAFINLFINNFFDATEITLLGLHVISTYLMYLYMQQLTKSAPAALAASLAWASTFYRYHLIVVLGKLPYGLFLCLWPLQFYLIERILEKPIYVRRLWAALTITVALILWTHVLYGTWMVALGMLYTVTRALISGAQEQTRVHIKSLAQIVAAHIAALFLAFYQLIPTLAESNLTGLGEVAGERQFALSTIGLENVLIFRDSYLTNWFGGYIGNTIIAVALLAIIVILIQHYLRGVPIIIQLAIALFMTFMPHYLPVLFNSIFLSIPYGHFAYAARSPGIYLIVAIGPLTVLFGIFVYVVSETLSQSWPILARRFGRQFLPERVAVIVVAVMLAETVPLTLWVNFKYPDEYVDGRPGRQSIVDALAHDQDKSSRVADVQAGIANTYTIPMLTGHPGLFGHGEEATSTIDTLSYLVRTLANETASGHLTSETVNLLYQLDIGYLITDASVHKINGIEEIVRTESSVLWKVSKHTPLVGTSLPIPGTGVVVHVLEGGDVPIEVLHYKATSITASLEFSLPQSAFVQAAYAAYPYQRVMLDGERIEITPTALGLIGFWASAGKHILVIEPELSPLRKWTLVISALSTVAALGIMVIPLRKKWR